MLIMFMQEEETKIHWSLLENLHSDAKYNYILNCRIQIVRNGDISVIPEQNVPVFFFLVG